MRCVSDNVKVVDIRYDGGGRWRGRLCDPLLITLLILEMKCGDRHVVAY